MEKKKKQRLFDRWTDEDEASLVSFLNCFKGRVHDTVEDVHNALKKTKFKPDDPNACCYAGIWLDNMSILYVVPDPDDDPYGEGYFQIEES